jgi:hypothetical protein
MWQSYKAHKKICGKNTEILNVVYVVTMQLTLQDWFSACQYKSIRATKTAATTSTKAPITMYTLLTDVKSFIIFVARLATRSLPKYTTSLVAEN